MKTKSLVTFTLIAISAFTASATIVYTAPCGNSTYTISRSAFENQQDANEYYSMLNDILCKNSSKTKENKDDEEDNSEGVEHYIDDDAIALDPEGN